MRYVYGSNIIFHRVENVIKLINKLKKLRIFRALQTSRVLHISMNARWRMNQLLRKKTTSVQIQTFSFYNWNENAFRGKACRSPKLTPVN